MRTQGISAWFKDSLYLFFLLCLIFIPFPLNIFPLRYTDAVFGKLITYIAHRLPGLPFHHPAITSDSASMYLLVLALLLIAFVSAGILRCIGKWESQRMKFILYARTLMTYYLAMQLLKYGFDKLFKQQFYLPEPNTLFTPLGQLSRDLAYWSVMGTSRTYSIFLGLCEVIPAFLILSRRTRGLGLLISVLVLANVAAVNLGFDISVKLYSVFLFAVSLNLAYPYFKNYYNAIFNRTNTNLNCGKLEFKSRRIYVFLKAFVTGLIFIEALYPYIRNGNYNDDMAQRPSLHGAYRIESFLVGKDTINVESRPGMLFFHRQGYLIFRLGEDKFTDYAARVDTLNHSVTLTGYQGRDFKCQYTIKNDLLYLDIAFDRPCHIIARAVDWKNLPLLRRDFHWTVDGLDTGTHN